jgi:hypothetical protein
MPKFESPVNVGTVVIDVCEYVNSQGVIINANRKLVTKEVPTSKNGHITFKVYDGFEVDDTEHGLMLISIKEFNNGLKEGYFKFAN